MNHSIILSKHYPSELTSYLDINKFWISVAMNKDNLRLHRRYVMYSSCMVFRLCHKSLRKNLWLWTALLVLMISIGLSMPDSVLRLTCNKSGCCRRHHSVTSKWENICFWRAEKLIARSFLVRLLSNKIMRLKNFDQFLIIFYNCTGSDYNRLCF